MTINLLILILHMLISSSSSSPSPSEEPTCGCSTSRIPNDTPFPPTPPNLNPNPNSCTPIDYSTKYPRKLAIKSYTLIPPGTFAQGHTPPQTLLNSKPPKLTKGGYAPADLRVWSPSEMDNETPTKEVHVDAFYIMTGEITNLQFSLFVNHTGYVTDSDKYGDSFVFIHQLPLSLSNTITQSVSGLEWWLPVTGASWLYPLGPTLPSVFESESESDSESEDLSNHPVVHISWNDATAYCEWQGGYLPSESQWEYASRGGKEARLYPWGNIEIPSNKFRANYFQDGFNSDAFPDGNTGEDGFNFTSPVGYHGAQNAYGLFDMVGNVWEWVSDDWGSGKENDKDKVKRGGSFLCHWRYCFRFRNSGRSSNSRDSGASNLGARCAMDMAEEVK